MKTCKTCGGPLEVRKTKVTPEKLKKAYYFSAYYWCDNCKKLYHNEKFKVENKNVDLFTHTPNSLSTVDVEIWTDGACVFNGTEHARAAWAFVSGKYEANGLVIGKQTNNTAEAYAIYHALLWASEQGYKKIKIYTDSQISIHSLQKAVDQVKANQEIFSLIHDLIHAQHLQVVYEKVLGHSGDINNERVDKLANSLASGK